MEHNTTNPRVLAFVLGLTLAACAQSVQLTDSSLPTDIVSDGLSSIDDPSGLPPLDLPPGVIPSVTPTATPSPSPTQPPPPPPPPPTPTPSGSACEINPLVTEDPAILMNLTREASFAHVEPGVILFEKRKAGPTTIAETRTAMVQNLGQTNLQISGIDIGTYNSSGVWTAAAGRFSVQPSSSFSLAPYATQTLTITFDRTSAGSDFRLIRIRYVNNNTSPSSNAEKTIEVYGVALSTDVIVEDVTTCKSLSTADRTYRLINDVSSSGTCFTIAANNVTLDLNDHKVTADVGVSSGSINGAVIKNGTIEATGANGVYIGAGSYNTVGSPLNSDEGLTIRVSAHNAKNFYTGSILSSVVANNTMDNFVTRVFNRHNLDGAIIKWEGGTNSAWAAEKKGRSVIFGNVLCGGPQGGIAAKMPGTQVFGNYVSNRPMDRAYANNFGIWLRNTDQEAFRNVIRQTYGGRGIMIRNDRSIVYQNSVVVHDRDIYYDGNGQSIEPDNQVYTAEPCGNGAYGIQVDSSDNGFKEGGNVHLFGNNVVSVADECEAKAFRETGTIGITSIKLFNNRFQGRRIGATMRPALAASIAYEDGDVFTLDGNHWIGDTAPIQLLGSASGTIHFVNSTFEKGSNPSGNYALLWFFEAGPVADLLNSTFLNGASTPPTRGSGTYTIH